MRQIHDPTRRHSSPLRFLEAPLSIISKNGIDPKIRDPKITRSQNARNRDAFFEVFIIINSSRCIIS